MRNKQESGGTTDLCNNRKGRGVIQTGTRASMPADILSELESLRTLEQVMLWAARRMPPAQFLKVVTQDEFTHDVVFEAPPEVFLVFDTN